MKKIILTSHGFQKNHNLEKQVFALLSKPANELSVVIITTASAEWKEQNKHAISAKQSFEGMGFSRVDFLDIEFEDPNKLKKYDVVYINGGNPFYLLHHLRHSSADKIIMQIVHQGKVVVGVSAGAVVLGPDINIVDFLDNKLNTIHLEDLTGLNLVSAIAFPHYTNELEEKIKLFEVKFGVKVTRLSDSQSIVLL